MGHNHDYFYYVMELADDAGPDSASAGLAARESGAPIAHPESYVPRTLKLEVGRRGRLAVAECLDIGLALTTALAHLHNHGLVHRDVKPSNVIFIQGIPKLADIGLVTDLDATVSCVGTEGFLPPEGPGAVQADIYALGKVLYEISTGKDRQDYPEPPTRLGEFEDREQLLELGEIVKKSCATDPAQRYQTAEAVQADLLLLKTGKSVRQAHQLERRLKLMTRAVAAVFAVMVLGVVPYALALKEAHRARAAEADTNAKLWSSYLAQAQAGRFSHRPGRRFEGLDLVRKAAALRPSLELRNEAIACLALRDMRLTKELGEGMPAGSLLQVNFQCRRYAYRNPAGDIELRSLEDDRALGRLPGFGAGSEDEFDFSPDGRLLAAFAPNKPFRLILWRLEDAKPILQLTNRLVRTPDFTEGNRRMVLCAPPNRLLLYDLTNREQIASYTVPSLPECFKLHPNGQTLAVSCTGDPKLRLINLASGQVIRELAGTAAALGLSWHPSGRWLSAAGEDGDDVVWDLDTGERTALKAHRRGSVGIELSPDGRLLASAGWDGWVRLLDLAEGLEVCCLPCTRYFVTSSLDGRWLGYASASGRLGLAEVANDDVYTELYITDKSGDSPKASAFSPDGRWLASVHYDGLRFWDLQTHRQVGYQKTEGELFSACFQPSRQRLLTSGMEGVKEWPLADGPAAPPARLGPPRLLAPFPDAWANFFDATPSTLALASGNGVDLCDGQTGQLKRRLPAGAHLRYAALSPDGRWCAAGTWETNVLWAFDLTDEHSSRLLPSCFSTTTLAFSPDSRWLALGGATEYRFLRTGSWEAACSVPNGGQRGQVAFSPDSRLAAIPYAGQCIRLIAPDTGRQFATLEPRLAQNIYSPAFSPDGSQLAVTTWSQLIQLWDLRRLRTELASMHLDWELPPYPPASPVDQGPVAAATLPTPNNPSPSPQPNHIILTERQKQ